MVHIPRSLRRKVAAAAQHRCGYCQTEQRVSGAQMHIDHLTPLAHGGTSDESNLWLACAWCNSFKGDATHAVDPKSGQRAPLFNPRIQRWGEHFSWSDNFTRVVGLTPTGRATVQALQMNNEFIVTARRYWVQAGWRPAVE
ncbi:MAG: HNH endonuclease [Anaerolineae bacterium]|nr:HNH endonuclease [Anaerolineae bacterium]